MIVGIVNELYEGLGPILFYVVLVSVLLHVIALVRKSRFFSSTRERYRVRSSIFFKDQKSYSQSSTKHTQTFWVWKFAVDVSTKRLGPGKIYYPDSTDSRKYR